jgi:uncharacterized protein (TIGR04255 family)
MTQFPHLTKAPITEAVIDFRVTAREGITAETIEAGLASRAFGYYKKAPILRGVFGFQLSAETGATAKVLPGSATVIGVRLHSSDEKYVAQFSTEGFALSRLEPYESWETLFAEAQRLWPIYAACVEPAVVSRVAARFINNLRLPLQVGDTFDKFLTQQPTYPPELPQAVSSFLQRFVLHDKDSGATIIVTQALEDSPPGGDVPVILDLDAYQNARFSSDGPEMWTCLGQLRVLKNKFFFASVTPKALEMYQ